MIADTPGGDTSSCVVNVDNVFSPHTFECQCPIHQRRTCFGLEDGFLCTPAESFRVVTKLCGRDFKPENKRCVCSHLRFSGM